MGQFWYALRVKEAQEGLSHLVFELFSPRIESFNNRISDKCVWIFIGIATCLPIDIPGPES